VEIISEHKQPLVDAWRRFYRLLVLFYYCSVCSKERDGTNCTAVMVRIAQPRAAALDQAKIGSAQDYPSFPSAAKNSIFGNPFARLGVRLDGRPLSP
jgi:hypothetical protein